MTKFFREFKHRIVFQIDNFVIIKSSELTRLEKMFLHKFFKNKLRLFARVIMIKNFDQPKLDSIFQTPYLKLIDIEKIINLSNIEYKKHYVLNIKRIAKEKKGKRLKKKGQILLLDLNYNIQFI